LQKRPIVLRSLLIEATPYVPECPTFPMNARVYVCVRERARESKRGRGNQRESESKQDRERERE